jgi:hypothetical protein
MRGPSRRVALDVDRQRREPQRPGFAANTPAILVPQLRQAPEASSA